MASKRDKLDFMGTKRTKKRARKATKTKRAYTRRSNVGDTVQLTIPSNARAAFNLGYQIARIGA